MNKKQKPNFLTSLLSALSLANYEDGKTPRARTDGNKKSGMTRRGAIHKHGKSFIPRQLLAVTPAQYRNQHLGRSK
jgi:hypothetical protein